MRLSLEGAVQTKENTMKLKNFSKAWKPGDTVRCFYPLYKDENGKPQLLVGATYGHRVSDIKQLGLRTAFIPVLTPRDEAGLPIGKPDILEQFSRIAGIFIAGMKKQELEQIARKKFPSEAMKKTELEKVEKKYNTKDNIDAVRPILGRCTFLITTECVVVPMINDEPDIDKARIYSQELSDERAHKLLSHIKNINYCDPSFEELGYLEVEYAFPLTEKSTAGRTEPAGQSNELRFVNKFPEAWAALQPTLERLPKDGTQIERHNYAYCKVDENAIRNALASYTIMHSEYLEDLDQEDEERLLKNAEVMENLSVVSALSEDSPIYNKIVEHLRELHAEDAVEEEETAVEIPEDFEGESGLAPDIDSMLANANHEEEPIELPID